MSFACEERKYHSESEASSESASNILANNPKRFPAYCFLPQPSSCAEAKVLISRCELPTAEVAEACRNRTYLSLLSQSH